MQTSKGAKYQTEADIFFLSKVQRIPQTDRKMEEAVLLETDENHTLITEIWYSQDFLGML